MSAYATPRLGLATQGALVEDDAESSVLDALLDQIADRVAAACSVRGSAIVPNLRTTSGSTPARRGIPRHASRHASEARG